MTLLSHLRQHAVAYLALIVALLATMTGTAYAAVKIANGSVTTAKLAPDAVTSIKIKNKTIKNPDLGLSSVRGTTVRDRSLTAKDFAPGAVPAATPRTFLEAATDTGVDPTPTPETSLHTHSFTLPRSGTLSVEFASPALGRNCSSGTARAGLYLDGKPVPGSGIAITNAANALPLFLVETVSTTAGPHVLSVADECPTGNVTGLVKNSRVTWSLALS